MKSFLSNLSGLSYSGCMSNLTILLFGLLIIGGGRIGIQATPESGVRWVEVFSTLPLWFGWLMVWFAFDGFFAGSKATTFVLSKTVVPVVHAVLSNIVGEEKLKAFEKHFEKKKKIRSVPLTLVEVKDLKGTAVMTKQAYERTVESVLDYAIQYGVEVKKEAEDEV